MQLYLHQGIHKKSILLTLGLLSSFAFALFGMPSYENAYKALNIAFALGLILILIDRDFSKSLFIWWAIGILIQVLGWMPLYFEHNQWATTKPAIDHLTKFFFFIPLAYLLANKKELIIPFWVTSSIGYLWIVFPTPNVISYWLETYHGGRSTFSLRSVMDVSLFSGFIFIGCLCLIPRVISTHRLRIIKSISLVVFLSLSFTLVVITQTRGIWLGCLCALIFMFCYLLKNKFRERRVIMAFIGLLGGGYIVISLSGFWKIIATRASYENDVIYNIITFNWNEIPMTSAGIRFHMWHKAWEYFLQRPFLGWDNPDVSKLIIRTMTNVPGHEHFSHFHSIYFETLVQYGLFGFVFLLAFIFYVAKNCILAKRSLNMPNDVYIFSWAFFIYFSISSIFEPYLKYYSGRFLVILMLAGIFAYCKNCKSE